MRVNQTVLYSSVTQEEAPILLLIIGLMLFVYFQKKQIILFYTKKQQHSKKELKPIHFEIKKNVLMQNSPISYTEHSLPFSNFVISKNRKVILLLILGIAALIEFGS